jgi:hypothetical protein
LKFTLVGASSVQKDRALIDRSGRVVIGVVHLRFLAGRLQSAALLDSGFQLQESLLLQGLRGLQLLNQLHLEHLHLHHVLLRLRNRLELFLNLLLHHHSSLRNLPPPGLFNLLPSNLLLHLNLLLLENVLLLHMLQVLLQTRLVLLRLHLRLSSLLSL